MRLVVQRVSSASVVVEDQRISAISNGLLVLVGIHKDDTFKAAEYLARKLLRLRIFQDQDDKMNLSLQDVDGELLLVSQFTLYGDTTKGNRPSFIDAMRPEQAAPFFDAFVQLMHKIYSKVQTGQFGAHMKVHLINDGPVTILIER